MDDSSAAAAGESSVKASQKKTTKPEVVQREKAGDAAKMEAPVQPEVPKEDQSLKENNSEKCDSVAAEVVEKQEVDQRTKSPKTPCSSPADYLDKTQTEEVDAAKSVAPVQPPASVEPSETKQSSSSTGVEVQVKPKPVVVQPQVLPVAMAREHIVDSLNLSQQQQQPPVSPDAVSPDELAAALRQIATTESEDDLNKRLMSEFVADFGIGCC